LVSFLRGGGYLKKTFKGPDGLVGLEELGTLLFNGGKNGFITTYGGKRYK